MTASNVFWSTGHGSYLHRWEQSSQESWLHALPGYGLWGKSRTRLASHKTWEVFRMYGKRQQSHKSRVIKAQQHCRAPKTRRDDRRGTDT